MNLIKESFSRLFPKKEFLLKTKLKYSKAFSGYNANIKLYREQIEVRLSKQWYPINKEIQIGLIQSLLLKLFKEKKHTANMDFYNNFIKNIHIAIPKTESSPQLKRSFERINNYYFYNLIEIPNLKFTDSINKLGSYNYGTDTITLSKYLQNAPQELLDYVMYHEMLHKKYKFKHKNNRNYHHTKVFRQKEKEFKNSNQIEIELKKLVTKNKIKKIFKFW